MKSAAPEYVGTLGQRLSWIRVGKSQPDRARELGVHTNTYARWERDEAGISAEALSAMVAEGWNANWLLTGEGPERLDALRVSEGDADYGSQHLSEEFLTVALELTDKALEGRWLPRHRYAHLVSLLYLGQLQGASYDDLWALLQRGLEQIDRGKTGSETDRGPGGQDLRRAGGGKRRE